jgi:SAM-dependent methyltransferase
MNIPVRLIDFDAFERREQCPSCRATSYAVVSGATAFGNGEDFPVGRASLSAAVRKRRRLLCCGGCALWYFDLVPRAEVLRDLLEGAGVVHRWTSCGADSVREAYVRAHHYLASIPAGVIADVGAHTGGFLDTLPPQWTKFAVEPIAHSGTTISAARLIQGYLEEAIIPKASFDCITAFDVFEHLYDIDRAVANVAQALRPGGLLIVETGDHGARAARIFRGGWYYLSFLEHFQAFDRASMAAAFERHGIELLQCTSVRHAVYPRRLRMRAMLAATLFGLLTAGGRAVAPWRLFNRCLRRDNAAAPPSTLALEPDHLFAVGRKR